LPKVIVGIVKDFLAITNQVLGDNCLNTNTSKCRYTWNFEEESYAISTRMTIA
jgi:hypothetical protein